MKKGHYSNMSTADISTKSAPEWREQKQPPAPQAMPSAPPRIIAKLMVKLRNGLLRFADKLVPAPVVLIERMSYILPRAIHAVLQLRVADHLAHGAKSTTELAQAIDAKEEYLYRLLRALVSYGVFEMDAEGRWQHNRLSRMLIEGGPCSLREFSMFTQAPWHDAAYQGLANNVRTGESAFMSAHGTELWSYLAAHPEDGAHFNGGMVALTQLDAPALAAGWDFAALGDGKLCDVAGGHGTLLANILARHPHLRGVLFDAPDVVAGAEPLLSRYGVTERVQCVGGSFFEAVPAGCSAYLMRDVLHDWNDERALAILRTVQQAMSSEARLLIAEVLVDQPRWRHFGALLDLEMMTVTSDGRQRSAEQFRALLGQAGLQLIRVVPTSAPICIIEAMRI